MSKGIYIKTEDHKRKIGLALKGRKLSKQRADKARIARFSNGRTLCENCHNKTDTFGNKTMEWKNIIGTGAISKVVKQSRRTDKLFFASGVSNSMEIREVEFQREKNLLLSQDKKRHIVYFSSLALFLPENEYNRYFWHKKEMEELVKTNFEKYTIVRIGNITWKNDNPNTIINYFKNKLAKNEKIEIQDAYRYLVDKKEFLYWINLIPTWPCEMNIPGKRMKVKEIVEEIKAGRL